MQRGKLDLGTGHVVVHTLELLLRLGACLQATANPQQNKKHRCRADHSNDKHLAEKVRRRRCLAIIHQMFAGFVEEHHDEQEQW